MHPGSRLPHLVRGTSAGVIATVASLFSHIAAGGAVPAPLGLLVPLVLSVTVAVLLAGRTLSLIRLTLSVVAAQLLFHWLFELGAVGASGSAVGGAVQPAHAGHGQVDPAALIPSAVHVGDHAHGGATMFIAHLVAAAITILLLYRGELAIHQLLLLGERITTWLRLRLPVPVQCGLPEAAPLHPVDGARGWSVLEQLHASTLRRRGPPGRV